MANERLEFTIVIEGAPDDEVLGRLVSLDLAGAAFQGVVRLHPRRNIALRHGGRILRRHDGEPAPEPPRDPKLKSWSAYLIGGRKLQPLGVVEAVSEAAAIEAAATLFGLDGARRRRLTINPRR